ncbi:MAG: hypothetical protein V1859_10585 [archaeon]
MAQDLFEVETDPILSAYNEEDIKTFVHDLFLAFQVASRIDEAYGEGASGKTGKNIDSFKLFIQDWNKKYRDILLKFSVTSIECRLDLFIYDTIKNSANIASKMKRFKQAKLYRKNGKIELEATFECSDASTNENTLNLIQDGNLLRMIYNKEDMLNAKSPEFKLCAYYGLKNGFVREIDLKKYSQEFSFDLTAESSKGEGEGWGRRYADIVFSRN